MRIVIILTLFSLAFVGILKAELQPPAPTPFKSIKKPQHPTQSNQPKTENDKRGTEDFPLVIKTFETQSDTAEKHRATDHREKEALNSKWTMRFAGGAVCIALFQLGFFYWQLMLMRKTVKDTEIAANAAKISADSLKEAERPYIFVRVEGSLSDTLVDGFAVWNCEYHVRNHGKTPAILANIFGRISRRGESLPIEKPEDDWIPRGGAIIGAGEQRTFHIEQQMNELEARNLDAGVTLDLLCYGRIDYKDIFGVDHFTKFCWEFQNRVYEKGFYLANDKKLNDYT